MSFRHRSQSNRDNRIRKPFHILLFAYQKPFYNFHYRNNILYPYIQICISPSFHLLPFHKQDPQPKQSPHIFSHVNQYEAFSFQTGKMVYLKIMFLVILSLKLYFNKVSAGFHKFAWILFKYILTVLTAEVIDFSFIF